MTRLERLEKGVALTEPLTVAPFGWDDVAWALSMLREAEKIMRDNGDGEDGPETDWLDKLREEV